MMDKINVLIFPAGSEIGIEIFHSLKYNLHFNIFGASGRSDHAKYLYKVDNYFEGDYYINNPDFIETFNSILIEKDIQFIFPTHDTITLFLIENQDKFKAIVLSSPFETAEIARDKNKTYKVFEGEDFCPIIFRDNYSQIKYPVFLKPSKGQGGKGTSIANNAEDLNQVLKKEDDIIVCEFLPGDELSVDCFTDRKRNLLFVGPRTRERVQMGISFNSKSLNITDEIYNIANVINEKLLIRGAWFFQVKRDINGKYKLLEFAVRQASTMGLYRQLGVNFALLTLFDRMGMDVKIIKNNYSIELDRCLHNRYKIDYKYENVYLDFDDTLILNDIVNIDAMKYVYYCRNNGISVTLLTKHKFNLNATLEQFGISKSLFSKIIHIDIEDDKLKYMNTTNSIFIDNYFIDRLRVINQLGIPVFDVDAIESLIR
jgi:predicted ATP-grasp superfamily ATP-dependent carboligase